jgi:hypothetical protein
MFNQLPQPGKVSTDLKRYGPTTTIIVKDVNSREEEAVKLLAFSVNTLIYLLKKGLRTYLDGKKP